MRSILLTGCSSGIGHACAIELARAGYRVFAGVRSDGDAATLRSEGATPVRIDVREADSVERAVEAVAFELGDDPLYGLVNNAGVSAPGPLEFLPLQELRTVLDVNLLGAVRTVQACLPLLRRGPGRIVNIGSGEGFLATPINGAYCMSKYALEAFSESLRMELAPLGLRVIVVEPGGTESRIFQKERSRYRALRESLPREAWDLYGPSIEARRRMPERGALQAPEVVALAVRRAFDATRPRPRSFAGADVRGAFLLGRFVPPRARDRVMRLLLGFPAAARGSGSPSA